MRPGVRPDRSHWSRDEACTSRPSIMVLVQDINQSLSSGSFAGNTLSVRPSAEKEKGKMKGVLLIRATARGLA
jgi:hypothetical protein